MVERIQQCFDFNQRNVVVLVLRVIGEDGFVFGLEAADDAHQIVLNYLSICKFGDGGEDAFQYFLKDSLFAESRPAVKVHQTIHQTVIAQRVDTLHQRLESINRIVANIII